MRERARSRRRPLDRRALAQLVGFVVGVNFVGGVPGVLFGLDTAWFRDLTKPWFYPPSIAFPIVWTLLFTLLGVALWLVWRAGDPEIAEARTLALGLFAVQFACNVAWTPAFFGLRSIVAGLAVLVVLWPLALATVPAFARVDRRAGVLLLPYVLWVTFALALTADFWRLNG
ncbi:TspO/MBR family protein [Halovivax limisalsi]|uniref:TspO/MBR family protein n=1 Tax=Halovivax limisalsi TaxID=1453760 RepID=UPI001FFDBD1B|nr:TspO/MBR family protein [Halovivax limisalsi]